MAKMSEYRCHKCETIHTTENVVAYCASCYVARDREFDDLLAKYLRREGDHVEELREKDRKIENLERYLEVQKEDNRQLVGQINQALAEVARLRLQLKEPK